MLYYFFYYMYYIIEIKLFDIEHEEKIRFNVILNDEMICTRFKMTFIFHIYMPHGRLMENSCILMITPWALISYFPMDIIIYFYVIQTGYTKECRLQSNICTYTKMHSFNSSVKYTFIIYSIYSKRSLIKYTFKIIYIYLKQKIYTICVLRQ